MAKFEGYMDSDSTIFDTLDAKLTPDLERDFDRNKEQIKKLLASEIMKHYYFQKGELIQSLKKDEVLDKALEVLSNPELYKQTLSAPEKTEEQPVAPKPKSGNGGGDLAYRYNQGLV